MKGNPSKDLGNGGTRGAAGDATAVVRSASRDRLARFLLSASISFPAF